MVAQVAVEATEKGALGQAEERRRHYVRGGGPLSIHPMNEYCNV